jgi:hypothetical protein
MLRREEGDVDSLTHRLPSCLDHVTRHMFQSESVVVAISICDSGVKLLVMLSMRACVVFSNWLRARIDHRCWRARHGGVAGVECCVGGAGDRLLQIRAVLVCSCVCMCVCMQYILYRRCVSIAREAQVQVCVATWSCQRCMSVAREEPVCVWMCGCVDVWMCGCVFCLV